MLRVAICDDEPIITSQMEDHVLAMGKRENFAIDTDVFYSGQELSDAVESGNRYDIIFLDIQMDMGDGIAAAKRLRQIDENALLIYVSGYDKYWMDLFRLDVFAFIKKPIDYELLERTLLEAVDKISGRRFYFPYRYKNREYKILCMDILYFESNGRLIRIHTRDGEVENFNGKLSDVEETLRTGKISFLRIHQSYLANYHHIRSRSKSEITLTNGECLPISEDRRKSFGASYSKLLGGEVDV